MDIQQNRSHQKQKAGGIRDHHGIRKANAILAAFLAVFFLVHAALGSLGAAHPISHNLAFLVWLGAGVLVIHTGTSIATTYFMYTDKIRPPSQRKKQHQVLKWATGAVLLALAAFHMAAQGGQTATTNPLQLIVLLALVAAIAVHSYTGIKSLTRDLDLSRSVRTPLRAGLVILAILVGVLAISAFGQLSI